MFYKNIEIFNVAHIRDNDENHSISWCRVPKDVQEKMESEDGKAFSCAATGVELRFVMKSDTVTIRMRTSRADGIFHVYRGSFQGGWDDHEVNKQVKGEFTDFVIRKSQNMELLKKIAADFDHPFSPEVVRVIMDRGFFEIQDIIGDVEPPKKEQLPKKTLFAYGSSITHGSNSIDTSHSWVSVLAHNLKMDARNLGMAGTCFMDDSIVDYIAEEGVQGNWDIAILELGINALNWEKDKIRKKVRNTLDQIAGKNSDKPIFVISPFYNVDDYLGEGKSEKWRELIEQIVKETNYANVSYINGKDLLGDMSLISSDEVHPNIYGVAQIAERLEKKIKEREQGGSYEI